MNSLQNMKFEKCIILIELIEASSHIIGFGIQSLDTSDSWSIYNSLMYSTNISNVGSLQFWIHPMVGLYLLV